MYVSTNDYIFKLISILSEHDLQYQSYFSYYTLYIMFFHVAKIIFKSLKFFTIKSIVIVSTNDSSLEPSFPFFHLHQYLINDEEADENSNENEIKSFFQ